MPFDRAQYNICMAPHISGQHADRKLDFCVGAKLCSGKIASLPEAEKICREQPPKEPKLRKGRGLGKTCAPQSLDAITNCLTTHIQINPTTTAAEMNRQLRDSLALCMCGQKTKRLSKAEQAVSSLDPEQREALIGFMAEHGTTTKQDKP